MIDPADVRDRRRSLRWRHIRCSFIDRPSTADQTMRFFHYTLAALSRYYLLACDVRCHQLAKRLPYF